MRFVNYLIKPASSLCNLRCSYCFYEDIAENRSCKSMGIMDEDTVRQLLMRTYSCVDVGGAVSFAFQGGEPTLAGLDFFRSFVAQAQQLRPSGVHISFAIQTNGILLDESWALFLRSSDFLVGLSLDGYKELHNLYRVDAAGKDTWNRVCRTLQLLQKHDVRVNILCVVTRLCARTPAKVYAQLKKLNVSYMQFIPCLDPMELARGNQPYSLNPENYASFLCQLFDLWYADWERGQYRSIRLFDDYVHALLGDKTGTCSTCGQCGSYFVVEGDGSVYPCDFYVLDRWKMGTLNEASLEEMAQGECASAFLAWGTQKPSECTLCRWRQLCNGGCKHDWLTVDGAPHNYFCPAFRLFFAHAESRLMHIARLEALARRSGMGK